MRGEAPNCLPELLLTDLAMFPPCQHWTSKTSRAFYYHAWDGACMRRTISILLQTRGLPWLLWILFSDVSSQSAFSPVKNSSTRGFFSWWCSVQGINSIHANLFRASNLSLWNLMERLYFAPSRTPVMEPSAIMPDSMLKPASWNCSLITERNVQIVLKHPFSTPGHFAAFQEPNWNLADRK